MAAGEGLRDSSRLRKRCELHRGNACDGVRELRHPVSGNDPGAASGEGCGEALPDSTAGADDQGLRGRHSRAGKPLLRQARRPRLGPRDERDCRNGGRTLRKFFRTQLFLFHSPLQGVLDRMFIFVVYPCQCVPGPCPALCEGVLCSEFVRFGQKLLPLQLALIWFVAYTHHVFCTPSVPTPHVKSLGYLRSTRPPSLLLPVMSTAQWLPERL